MNDKILSVFLCNLELDKGINGSLVFPLRGTNCQQLIASLDLFKVFVTSLLQS